MCLAEGDPFANVAFEDSRVCYLRERMYRTPSPPPPPKRDLAKVVTYVLVSVLLPIALFGCFVWFVVGMCGRWH